MWWDEREKFPSAFGFIRTKAKPGSPDANISFPGGPADVWDFATQLIAEYEQNLYRQNNPQFRLRHVWLVERLAAPIPPCPSPLKVDVGSAPHKFCSMGLCVRHGLAAEIWYTLRAERAGNALYWRLDITERFTPWFRALIFGFGAVWFCLALFISILIFSFGSFFPLGVLFIPFFLIWAFFNRESTNTWWLYCWPFRLFESTRESRLDDALTYAPAVSGALEAAVRVVERSIQTKQVLGKQQTNKNASSQKTPSVTTTSRSAAPPRQGKLRK